MKRTLLFIVVSLLLLMGFVYWHYHAVNARIVMCDVGQGDTLVLTRGYSQLVIDVGPNNGGSLDCLGKLMPFWDKTIEAIMITHADADHSGGLNAILSHYHIGTILVTANEKQIIQSVVGDRFPIQVVGSGDEWQWAGFRGKVIWPDRDLSGVDTNYASLVQRIELSSPESIWVGGDAPSEVERVLLQRGLVVPTTIYKVSHHGSSSSTSSDFLGILQPHQAWISVGKGNRYGHPSTTVTDLLLEKSITTRRTDLEGSIVQELLEE